MLLFKQIIHSSLGVVNTCWVYHDITVSKRTSVGLAAILMLACEEEVDGRCTELIVLSMCIFLFDYLFSHQL